MQNPVSRDFAFLLRAQGKGRFWSSRVQSDIDAKQFLEEAVARGLGVGFLASPRAEEGCFARGLGQRLPDGSSRAESTRAASPARPSPSRLRRAADSRSIPTSRSHASANIAQPAECERLKQSGRSGMNAGESAGLPWAPYSKLSSEAGWLQSGAEEAAEKPASRHIMATIAFEMEPRRPRLFRGIEQCVEFSKVRGREGFEVRGPEFDTAHGRVG